MNRSLVQNFRSKKTVHILYVLFVLISLLGVSVRPTSSAKANNPDITDTQVNVADVLLEPTPVFSSGIIPVDLEIPDFNSDLNGTGVTSSFVVSQNITLDFVEVVFNATHDFRGDLKVVLTSPLGTQSVLVDKQDDPTHDYIAWEFMTVLNRGESSVGTWTLKVTDESGGTGFGTFDWWKLNFYVGSYVGGGDTAGVFRPSNGLLYLKNTNLTGFADVAINYGTGGDYPVVGDWDGNGTDTIGIYRDGSFYLRNSNTVGFADIVFAFGSPGDQPVAGDWDGDGIDTIGVYRSSAISFMLRNTNSTGAPDVSFLLGLPGDIGIAGDWNGDGTDTTGVFRPSNGIIFMKNANTSGFAEIGINYGLASDQPVIGDWDNDGIDTIGVYRNAQFLLRNSNTLGFADLVFDLGNPGDMPIAGNWDGIP
jgi:subtilisin-like proprotein convertase family protein